MSRSIQCAHVTEYHGFRICACSDVTPYAHPLWDLAWKQRIMTQPLSRFHHALTALVLLCCTCTTPADDSIANIRQLQHDLRHEKFMLRLHAVATLSNISVNGLKVSELSGLAWDQDEKLLYALSDNGYLLDLQPVFSGHILRDIRLQSGHRLLDENGKPLKYRQADSEGLALEHGHNGRRGDTRLIVSFERFPRLIRYKRDGTFESRLTLPPELEDVTRYRSDNKALEAVTGHPAYGILTGPEFPLKDTESGTLNIYSLRGDHWAFPAHGKTSGALVDMVTLEDGKIIVLERAYDGLLSGIQTTLHRIILNGQQIQADQIHTFTPEEGLFDDNFEGITHLDKNYFMMVSDDNNHPLKRTLLVYFEIIEDK